MTRVDVWDVVRQQQQDEDVDMGLPRSVYNRYDFGAELGRGGFGVVRVARNVNSGEELACKMVPKQLTGPGITEIKQAQHLARIRQEIEVMRRLRNSPNVAQFRGAYEDGTHVHLLMEWCRGGELWHRIGRAHYSEKTCASYMRAVLRTAAQCHAQRILHRDIKPGNFMLLSDAPNAPLKAIDFGLAVTFDAHALPRTDLGLEGTPWFMAPEVLEHEVGPAADVWSAGVMAYQLLSGHLPFDDRRNPRGRSVSRIWQAIFTQQPDLAGDAWLDISDAAKDFVRQLLNKDPTQRPTAVQALEHEWLQGSIADRTAGRPLNQTVALRLQRLHQAGYLKRTVSKRSLAEALETTMVNEETFAAAAAAAAAQEAEQQSLDLTMLVSSGQGQSLRIQRSPQQPLIGRGRQGDAVHRARSSSLCARQTLRPRPPSRTRGGATWHPPPGCGSRSLKLSLCL